MSIGPGSAEKAVGVCWQCGAECDINGMATPPRSEPSDSALLQVLRERLFSDELEYVLQKARDLDSQQPGGEAVAETHCCWNQEDEDGDHWGTSCGHAFRIDADTPEENGMRYCCYCGGKIEQSLWVDEIAVAPDGGKDAQGSSEK